MLLAAGNFAAMAPPTFYVIIACIGAVAQQSTCSADFEHQHAVQQQRPSQAVLHAHSLLLLLLLLLLQHDFNCTLAHHRQP
jgi:hypothetical protein